MLLGLKSDLGRVCITVRLGQPLGFRANADLGVLSLTPGGQIELRGGVNPGDRLVEAGGQVLRTNDEFKALIQEHKDKGAQSLDLVFADTEGLASTPDVPETWEPCDEAAAGFAEAHGIPYAKCSAKTGEGAREALAIMVRAIASRPPFRSEFEARATEDANSTRTKDPTNGTRDPGSSCVVA